MREDTVKEMSCKGAEGVGVEGPVLSEGTAGKRHEL